MQQYAKSHLSFKEQVSHLESLGLDCAQNDAALATLQDIGYYRLTAYLYPFRRLLAEDEPKETLFQYRAAEYEAGAKFSDAVALCRFDHAFRAKVFAGTGSLELALRVQIAYVLGKRDKFGHTNRLALDEKACSGSAPSRFRDEYQDMFTYWLATYRKLIGRASAEDFISHVKQKYSGEIPIWIAIETFDFGGLTRLYGLLNKYDQNLIAQKFGVTNGRVFHKWLVGIGVIRNHCAHHNRLWNRQLPGELASLPHAAIGCQLWHLDAIKYRRKLYVWLAVLAYSLRSYDDTSNWHRTLATHVAKKFPDIASVTVENDMGFPSGWREQPLWNTPPAGTRTLPTAS